MKLLQFVARRRDLALTRLTTGPAETKVRLRRRRPQFVSGTSIDAATRAALSSALTSPQLLALLSKDLCFSLLADAS